MSMKKMFAILGCLLILGFGAGVAAQENPAQEKNQVQEKNKVRNGTQGEASTPLQNRLMFRDENGDGICDNFQDHDNDGIPNGQDPDWSRSKDGRGNQSRFGDTNSGDKYGVRKGQNGGNAWSKRSFRQNRVGGGKGVRGKDSSRGNLRKGGKQ